jgi:uncharacterized protein YaiI (UPF0178 family)
MKILVDADACPVPVKEMIFKAANRTEIQTTLLANHYMKVPPSPFISFTQVSTGFDVADDEIVKLCEAGDLVITSDIPLADEVISKGALALTSRGELYTKDNIKAKLNMRDFMDTMRSSGIEQSGGQAPFNNTDKQAFANQLDKLIAKAKR